MLDKITVTDLLNNEINPITQFDDAWYSIPYCHHNILIYGLSFANILEKMFTLYFWYISLHRHDKLPITTHKMTKVQKFI